MTDSRTHDNSQILIFHSSLLFCTGQGDREAALFRFVKQAGVFDYFLKFFLVASDKMYTFAVRNTSEAYSHTERRAYDTTDTTPYYII